MNILKIFKSNAFIFFIAALILLSFSVHTMGSRKNSILDTFKGSEPGNFLGDNTDKSGQMSSNAAPDNKAKQPVAGMGKQNPKPLQQKINPADLLPNENNDLSNLNKNLISGPPRYISKQSDTLRNANLQIRSDPPVGNSETGPWNQATIQPDKMRKQFELGSSAAESNVSGYTARCPSWTASTIDESGSSVLQPPSRV